ncbi:MAG: restriction endonuclease subunit S [Prevotella sp.]|nr:restriction endonuclease subunit S [Prevotella sp.]
MSEWKTVRLGDVVSIKSGLSYKSEFLGKGDNLLLGMGCVSYKDRFVDSGARPYYQDCDSKYLAVPGDLVLATRQQSDNLPILAMPAIIPEKYRGKKIIIGTNLYKVENGSDIDNRFLFLVLKGHDYVNYIRGVKTGTTVQMVSKRNVEDFQFLCPPKETRERIVSILSRYDALIENYQQQTKLLEEAGQRLYKEWFVDFHFPGYESTIIIDGVPERWEKKTLEDICSISKRVIQLSDIKEGRPYIGLEHMPRKDFCLSEWGNSEQINSSKYEYKESDILFGKIRPYFHKVGFAINDGYASTDSIIMQSKPGMWALLLMTVSSEQFVNYTSQTCKEGAKMPRADWNQMKKYPVLIACDTIQKEFERRCKLIANEIKANALQIHLLTEARDRLLPKLMSGEICVEVAQSVTNGLGVRKEQTDSPQASDS